MIKRQTSINQTIKQCPYVLQPATATAPAKYCNRNNNWRIVLDEDDRRVRHYDHFCFKHNKIINEDEAEG
jgi:hypothetical protein